MPLTSITYIAGESAERLDFRHTNFAFGNHRIVRNVPVSQASAIAMHSFTEPMACEKLEKELPRYRIAFNLLLALALLSILASALIK